MRLALAIPVLALVLAGPAARAEDVAPVISRVEVAGQPVESSFAGGAITIVGARLHECLEAPVACEHRDLRVSIDGKPCMLLSASSNRLVVLVPADATIGKATLRVDVVGRGASEARLEVEAAPEWIRLPLRPLSPPRPEDDPKRRRDAKEQAILDSFSIDRFEHVGDERGWRFEVAGKATRLSDGLELRVALVLDEVAVIEVQKVRVTRGAWRATLCSSTRSHPLGTYTASMEFELGKQPRVLVRRFRERLEEDEHALFDRVVRREFVHLGTPDEIAAHRAPVRDHVRDALERADRLLDDVERAYASASRAAFARAVPVRLACPRSIGLVVVPGVDAAAHAAHLRAIGLAPTDAALARLLADDRFGAALGHVDAAALVAWFEGQALPALAALEERLRAFDARTAVPIDARVSHGLELLVIDLGRTLRRTARGLYRTAGVVPPSSLAGEPEPAGSLDRAGLEARKAELFQRVGLR